jgi:hypothetical protein
MKHKVKCVLLTAQLFALHFCSPGASAETVKGILLVSANIAPTCTISASTVTRDPHDPDAPTRRHVSGVITTSCNSGANTRIVVDEPADSAPERQLANQTQKVTIGVDQNSGLTTVGGNSITTPTIVSENGSVQRFAFYVQVSARGGLSDRSDSRAIVATVSF